jgi:hypothetical protein
MSEMGVDVVRVSPQAYHTPKILGLFRDAMEGRIAPADALAQMAKLMPDAPVDGYWHGKPGVEQSAAAA